MSDYNYSRLNEKKDSKIYKKLDELIDVLISMAKKLDSDKGAEDEDFESSLVSDLKKMKEELK